MSDLLLKKYVYLKNIKEIRDEKRPVEPKILTTGKLETESGKAKQSNSMTTSQKMRD